MKVSLIALFLAVVALNVTLLPSSPPTSFDSSAHENGVYQPQNPPAAGQPARESRDPGDHAGGHRGTHVTVSHVCFADARCRRAGAYPSGCIDTISIFLRNDSVLFSMSNTAKAAYSGCSLDI